MPAGWIAGYWDYSNEDVAMTNTYRNTDNQAPDLSQRKTINWPERMVTMELHLVELQDSFREIRKESQVAMVRMAEANERLANHFEDSKRLHQRIDEHDAQKEDLRNGMHRLEKCLLEVQLQNKILIDFSSGIKRAGFIVVTCGGAVLWWIIQRWVENHGK